MSTNKPIHSIAKELGIESNRILLACKDLGIYAKGSSKRLNSQELKKIETYFKSGKNASSETIEVKNINAPKKVEKVINKNNLTNKKESITYFPNRLVR